MPKVKIVKKERVGFYAALKAFSQRFTIVEIENILIAWIVLSLAFAYVLDGGAIATGGFILVFVASAIVLGCGFIMHELMHKFTAQKYRYRAEFRIWVWGIFLAIITALFGFIFAAPGATYFEPDPREQFLDPKGFRERYGMISFAVPRINIIFGFIFLGFFLLLTLVAGKVSSSWVAFGILVTALGSYINFYLAAFNLIPINPLDGYKVINWNKKIWITFFVIAIAMTIINFIYVVPAIF